MTACGTEAWRVSARCLVALHAEPIAQWLSNGPSHGWDLVLALGYYGQDEWVSQRILRLLREDGWIERGLPEPRRPEEIDAPWKVYAKHGMWREYDFAISATDKARSLSIEQLEQALAGGAQRGHGQLRLRQDCRGELV